MRKKVLKLVLVSMVLAAGLGLTPKVANAGWCPEYYCCDPYCFGIRYCWRVGASCICEQYCQPNPGGGLD